MQYGGIDKRAKGGDDMDMAKKQIAFRIDEDLLAAADEVAQQLNQPRTVVLSTAIRDFVEQSPEARHSAIKSYLLRGLPAEPPK